MSVLTQADLEEILAMLDDAPEYHYSGMGCGLEDRNIHNRYEAMQHGWDSAIERVYGEHVNPAIEAIKAAIEKTVTPSPQDHLEGPQDISTAPAMTDVLVWWPIVKLDEDGDPTDEIVGGCWIISEDQGGYWIEPEVMNAIGDHMGDDHTYADKPSKWLPLPAPLFTAASEGSTDV